MTPGKEHPLLTAVRIYDIAFQRLDPEDQMILTTYENEINRLKEVRGISERENEPEDLLEEAHQNIPGSREAEKRYKKKIKILKKAGYG